ncbi:MAG: hypothetical protein OXD47_04750 [Gammaproteobacteria bacterium]|nr:hypothetical protein [Gammaproteobacteria bacterium]MCY4282858.1 hypothetical protein [Gammaproteobacteria bacterium]MCY4338093.1 hypothetical protein [Gammaproteobacteria bacterium]
MIATRKTFPDVMSSKVANAAMLSVILFLTGAGTVSAEMISYCEYWHGTADDVCVPAFERSHAAYNEGSGTGCKVQYTNGFPRWAGRTLGFFDPDNDFNFLNDTQRSTILEMITQWGQERGEQCHCLVRVQCQWVTSATDNDFTETLNAVDDDFTQTATCDAPPIVLRETRFDGGEITPTICK